MKITESIILNISANPIWEILQNPGNMPAWNPKCYACSGKSGVSVGSTFEAVFMMRGKSKRAFCEVIALTPYEKITIRYSGEAFSSGDGFVDETFYLINEGPGQTKIELEVDFTNSGLPMPIKFIMWFISRFGYKAGRSSLDGIKDLLE